MASLTGVGLAAMVTTVRTMKMTTPASTLLHQAHHLLTLLAVFQLRKTFCKSCSHHRRCSPIRWVHTLPVSLWMLNRLQRVCEKVKSTL